MIFLDYAPQILQGIMVSLGLTLLSFAIGAIFAVPIALARKSKNRLLRFLSGGYIEIARGIPPIAWLFILFFGMNQFGIVWNNFTAAVIGLGIIAAGYLAEIYRSGLNAVPVGQKEASAALSLTATRSFTHVVAPQALITALPLAVAYFIGLLKDSAIASTIGVQDITTQALFLSRRSLDTLTIFLGAGALYLVISIPVALFGKWLGDKIAERWVGDHGH